MKITMRTLILVLFLLGTHFCIVAQQYPVQVTTAITPPYSLYLSDYTSAESNSLQVLINLYELDRTNLRVKLRVTLEGAGITLRTNPSYVPPAIILQGGSPELLTGFDLRNYLNPDHLDFSGTSKAAFIRTGRLPEGFYTLTLEVLDYVRNNRISNQSTANAWIMLNDPPLINIPFNGDKLTATDPQNIMFSWTPRHTASPNAAFTTEYEFKLVEMYPGQTNPDVAIRSSNSIYKTTTTLTSLNYGIIEPTLVPGKKYAFRVRAYDTRGRDLFKNNGYSETYVFQYGDACILPAEIKGEALDPYRVRIQWEAGQIHSGFILDHRRSGSNEWFGEDTYSNSLIIPELTGGTTYEYRIRPKCGSVLGDYSPVYTVTTLIEEPKDFVCGADMPDIELNQNPLQKTLFPNDIIETADWEVRVETAEATGDGVYKGTGFALVPLFKNASIRVTFDGIKVNEDYRVIQGNIRTVYTENTRFVEDLTKEEEKLAEQGKEEDEETGNSSEDDEGEGPVSGDVVADTKVIEGEIADVISNEDGTITVVKEDGTKEVIKPDEDGNTTIADSSGNQWVVDSAGNVSGGGSDSGGIASGSGGSGETICDPEKGVFGPITVAYSNPPTQEETSGGSCVYAVKGDFGLPLLGAGLEHHFKLEGVDITYTKNCQSGAFEQATFTYEHTKGVDVDRLGFLDARLKRVVINVDSKGSLSGEVVIHTQLTEELRLSKMEGYSSLNTKLDMVLEQGISGEVSFSFAGGSRFNGEWDFSGLNNLELTMYYGEDVLGKVTNGSLTNEGGFAGTFITGRAYEFSTQQVKVTWEKLNITGGVSLDDKVGLNGFYITEGIGQVKISDIKGIQGSGTVELSYGAQGLTGQVVSDELRSFGMNISDLDLSVRFNKFLGFESVSGSFKAKHDRFDGFVKIQDFRLANSNLESFNMSGEVKFGEKKLRIQQSTYDPDKDLLKVDASFISGTADSPVILMIEGFKIYSDGTIEEGTISGTVDSGEMFGPLRVTFDIPQSKGQDNEGYNIYEDIEGSLLLKLKDESEEESEKELAIKAKISYKKHPQTEKYKDVEIFWEGAADLGAVGFVKGEANEINIMVSGDGKVSGYVKCKASLTENVKLAELIPSSVQDFDLVIHKGLTGNIKFNFSSGNNLKGKWDLTELTNINGDLIKNGSIIAKLENGSMNGEKELTGKIKSYQQSSFTSKYCKLTVKSMNMKFFVSTSEGLSSFKVTEGTAKFEVSEMEGLNGPLIADAEYVDGVGLKGTVDSEGSEISAFSMTLSDLALTVELNDQFDLLSISGGVKAVHPKVKGELNITNFKIEEGRLSRFSGSGSLIYKGFDLDVSSLNYKNKSLEASSSIILNFSGNSQRLDIDNLTISNEGEISIGGIAGEIKKGDYAKLGFEASFSDDKFRGTFDGDLALIGLEGTVDIGTAGSETQTYTYGYLKVEGKSGVGIPIGPTGLKLTQMGGELGFNYKLNFSEGTENSEGKPEKGTYVAGLLLGVSDLANMCEVVGNPRIQFGNKPFEIQFNGSISIPRHRPLFEGDLAATYRSANNSFQGKVTSKFTVPAKKVGIIKAGSILRTEDAELTFDVVGKQWKANSIVKGSFLNSLNFSGSLNLKSETFEGDSEVTGTLFGSLSYEYTTEYKKDSWLADIEMKLDVGFSSTLNVELLESSFNGSIGGTVHGMGYLKVDSAIDFEVMLEGSASAEVSYISGQGNLKSKLNLKVVSGDFDRKIPEISVDVNL